MMAREAELDKRKVAFTPTPPTADGNPLQGFISNIQGGEYKNNTLHPKGFIPIIVYGEASHLIQIPFPQDNYVDLSQQYEDKDHMVMT